MILLEVNRGKNIEAQKLKVIIILKNALRFALVKK